MREALLIEKIDAVLPQTQCRQCGFPGCKPYAVAIAHGIAEINQCPPGGAEGIQQLADLLGVRPIPLNTAHGAPKPKAVALVDEQVCIGCALCILACPVDAIVGAAKQMHTVIAEECTGCELCIAPCPVDSISMIPVSKQTSGAEREKKTTDRARARYQFRLKRLEREREKQERTEKFSQKATRTVIAVPASDGPGKAVIQAALARAMTARVQITKEK